MKFSECGMHLKGLRRAAFVAAIVGAASVPVRGAGDRYPAYTNVLVGEALLSGDIASLRASMLYAEAAGVGTEPAADELSQGEGVLEQVRGELRPEERDPDLRSMDLERMRRRMDSARAGVKEAIGALRESLEASTGAACSGPRFEPLPELTGGGGAITNQMVFAALAPTRQWAGWGEGAAAWGPLRALDLQCLSPWFGWYSGVGGGSLAQDAERIRQMAGRLEAVGLPLLVWLEPEYNVAHLWDEIGEEMYLHDAEGNWQRRTRINNTINIFHPRVREEMRAWLEQLGGRHRGDDRIIGYELVEEPALRFDASDPKSPDREPRYGGYSAAALAGFRARLRDTYGDIGSLNGKWGSEYESFEAVVPPAELVRRDGKWEGQEVALLAEFQKHRAAAHAECFREMVAALHRANPGRPVIPQFTTPLFGDPLGGVDLFRMGEAGWDIITFHTDTAHPYVYSIARYLNKPIWNDEYIWSNRARREETGEVGLRAVARMNLWRNVMWGARGFVLFNLDFAWDHPKDGGDWNNDLLDARLGDRAPRYAAGAFPRILRTVPTFFDELYESRVVDEGLLILEPTTSIYAAVPTGTAQWWARRITAELTRWFYRPAFCPERYIASGREDLSGYRTVVVPVGKYVPEAVVRKLWEWVTSGGTLVALGPFATHDEYGRQRSSEAAFGAIRPGERADIGEGTVVRVPIRGSVDDIATAVRRAVGDATGERAATATDTRLEIMLRAVGEQERLVIVLNGSAGERVKATVRVRGEFEGITDVTIEGHMPVPAIGDGEISEIPANLVPGEARVFMLD